MRKPAKAKTKPTLPRPTAKPAAATGTLNDAIAAFHNRQPDVADAMLRPLLAATPNNPEILHIAGAVALSRKDYSGAVALLQRAAQQLDHNASVHSNLGIALKNLGRLPEAEAAYQKALALQPDFAECFNNLGNLYQIWWRLFEARDAYQKAIHHRPNYPESLSNLSRVYTLLGLFEEAETAARQAIAADPHFADGYSNLGGALMGQDRMAETEAAYRTAMTLKPDFVIANSNFLFCLNYRTDLTGEEIFTEYQAWDQRHARPLLPHAPHHPNIPDPERPLRLGYVSPDFRSHAVSFFFEPLLAAHDRQSWEIFGYSESVKADEVTERLRHLCHHWRSTVGLSDEQVAAMVREDQIDILVDLAGHTANNRLLVFARRPAPVQISYLIGFGNTTGMRAMDAFLADEAMVPANFDHLFSEKVIRLPRIPLVYQPPAEMPEVGPLPALRNHCITFGSYSRAVRINEKVVATWAAILRGLPGSRLVLNNKPFHTRAGQENIQQRFAAHGIAPERLILTYTQPQTKTWASYNAIDIVLDPFPHNAGTTTFEALWMGVPVVSLADRPPVGRFGATILGALGMADWVATSPEEYGRIAVAAAGDLPRLAALRAGLRQRFQNSPLCDPAGLTAAMEEAYRNLWRGWCHGRPIHKKDRPRPAQPPKPVQPGPRATAPVTDFNQEFARAVSHYSRGELEQAADLCRRIVAHNPGFAQVHHLLGIILYAQNRNLEAIAAFDAAIAIQGETAEFHANRGAALRRAGRRDEAAAAYQRAIRLDPNMVNAYGNHGNLLLEMENFPAARDQYQSALRLQPDNHEYWNSLGRCLHNLAQTEAARQAYEKAMALNPGFVDAYANLGALFMAVNHLEASETILRRALVIAPDNVSVLANLAITLWSQGRFAEAEQLNRQVITQRPNLDNLYKFCNNLGVILQDQGRLAEAEELFKQALAIKPDYPGGHGSYLFCLNYRWDLPAEKIFAEYQRWNQKHALPLLPATLAHANTPEPQRRLKLGYVSPDFRHHAVSFFMEAIFIAQSRQAFETYAYAQVADPDQTTARLQGLVDHWRSTVGLSDQQMAELIRRDGIDILVDLAGHTKDNRLLVFARKPAPIQISYLVGAGYTSGLTAMDAFLADAAMVPAGFDHLFSEKVVRLSRTPLAYHPPESMPEVGPLPARRKGFVTFGSFTRLSRVNPLVIELWSTILLAVPGSRLVLNNRFFVEAAGRTLFADQFAAHGIPGERLDLIYTQPQPATWEAYNTIDIALDPFPHNAGTTTFEALWMGVPVISRNDRPSVGRFGATILGALGMADWAVDTREDYLRLAVATATDLDRLAAIRAGLRDRFRASPLLDPLGLTREMEAAFRQLWQEWCTKNGAPPPPSLDTEYQQAMAALHGRDLQGAEQQCKKILAGNPDHAPSQNLLATLLFNRGEIDQAAHHFTRAATLAPHRADFLSDLGVVLRRLGRLPAAIEAYQRAIRLAPDLLPAHENLANALHQLGRYPEEEAILRHLLTLQPDQAGFHHALGKNRFIQANYLPALEDYQRAIALQPDFAAAISNLGGLFMAIGRYDEAEETMQRAVQLDPDSAELWGNIGILYQEMGRFDDSVHACRRALTLRPNYALAHGSLLFSLNYHPDHTPEEIFREYQQWNNQHAQPLVPARPHHDNPPEAERPLAIGYVSPDFYNHPVARFLEPLLAAHNPATCKLFCYADVTLPDDTTARFRQLAHVWRPINGLDDQTLAELIRRDGIDVLVDLTGHTAGNRLLTLARRPAPVQISYLIGHGYTTGLTVLDGFLADEHLVPPEAESLFSEPVVRLARPPFAFQPLPDMPAVGPLPASQNGFITFGCFSRAVRLNSRVMACWAAILREIPTARLVINNKFCAQPAGRHTLQQRFTAHGIDPERLHLCYTTPQSLTWQTYNTIDIALDPFPHNAGLTTFEALYMGVPVISLADRPSVGRFGASILGAMALSEWLAGSPEEYQRIAIAAASHPERLAALRTSLRSRLQNSPLMDGHGLAREVETVYRQLWRGWCSRQTTPGATTPDAYEEALALFQQNDLDGAVALAGTALRQTPANPRLLHLLATLHFQKDDKEKALELFTQATTLAPDVAEFHADMGVALKAMGRMQEAIATYQRAARLNPGLFTVQNNLGNALVTFGAMPQAEEAFRKAMAIKPDFADAHYNLGNVLMDVGRVAEAEQAYRQAIALDPSMASAYQNLGCLLTDLGQIEAGEKSLRQALIANPKDAAAHGSLLFRLNYRADLSGEEIFQEYQRWNRQHALPLLPAPLVHDNPPQPQRRLRLGYVSPDFRDHVVCYFIEPILTAHNREQFEVYCYAEVYNPDPYTQRIKQLADRWQITVGLSHQRMAEMIRRDGIDILVDLAGHTSRNRLLVFARKPAPVQVCYLIGQGYTTGLTAIDAFLADDQLVPPGYEYLFSEPVIARLSRAPFVYKPPSEMPAVGPLPAKKNGMVTFGSFTRTVRINDQVIALWARILHAVPGARLMLNNKPMAEDAGRAHFLTRFADHGIPPERLLLVFTTPKNVTWATYNEIDIALDPFPHNGGTTTFEALWMGVPMVSLADRPSVGRFGASILGTMGLSNWVAATTEEYLRIAVTAAQNPDRLAELRATLRQRFIASPLMDPAGLTREIETAYRQLWADWCARTTHTPPPPPPPTPMAAQEEWAIALHHFQKNEPAKAERLAEAILHRFPHHSPTLHLLGTIAHQKKEWPRAVHLLQKAAATAADPAPVYSDLGVVLRAAHRLQEAEQAYRQAIRLQPGLVNAWSNLANLLALLHRIPEATAAYRQALSLQPTPDMQLRLAQCLESNDEASEAAACYQPLRHAMPDNPAVLLGAGRCAARIGNTGEAEKIFRHLVQHFPSQAAGYEALCQLLRNNDRPDEIPPLVDALLAHGADQPEKLAIAAQIFARMGRYQEAEALCFRGLDHSPPSAALHSTLGDILTAQGKIEAAISAFRQAIALDPHHPHGYNNLGVVLRQRGYLHESETLLRQAMQQFPHSQEFPYNLGVNLLDQCRFQEADAIFRPMAEEQQLFRSGSNLLFCTNYRPDKSSREVFAEYQRWNERHALPLLPAPLHHANTPDPARRLRLGFVSPDFCYHSVPTFFEPLLRAHDRSSFEIFAYAEVKNPDATTHRLQTLVDHWRFTVGMSDAHLAETIRQDGIDVLVDLAGHTGDNRLLVFARKPAPVQVTNLIGHGYTTGLTAIDAIAMDGELVPPGTECWFSERVFRLDRPPFVYLPPPEMPAVGPLPALSHGHITFGSFSRIVRFNDAVVALWARILREIPTARLLLNHRPFAEEAMRRDFEQRFAGHGIAPQRLELLATPPQGETWACYNRVDIALDPFPHNAGTTTLEALWMGVPVLSLKDRPSVGRFGASILGALAMAEWAVASREAYVQKAITASADLGQLAVLRGGLRGRFAASPLQDVAGLVRDLEGLYRTLWQAWCQGR